MSLSYIIKSVGKKSPLFLSITKKFPLSLLRRLKGAGGKPHDRPRDATFHFEKIKNKKFDDI